MFWIILIILCLLISGASHYLDKISITDYSEAKGAWIIAATVVSVIACIIQVILFQVNISDYENITYQYHAKEIYIEKKNVLQTKYESLLDSSYQKHESKIFKDISQGKMGAEKMDLTFYPQIKYANMLLDLTKQIDKLNSVIYNCDVKIADYQKSIRIRYKSPFVINLFYPKPHKILY